MPYKDIEKKREANRKRVAKYRAKQKGVTDLVTPEKEINHVTPLKPVTPELGNAQIENINVTPSENVTPLKIVDQVTPKNQSGEYVTPEPSGKRVETVNGKCQGYKVDPITKLHFCNSCDYHRERNQTKPWLKTKEPKLVEPKSQEVEPSKLWTDYYSVKKPTCANCLKAGIKENEYRFCSSLRKWNPALKKYFPVCLVKHWILYQGQGKTNEPTGKQTAQNNTIPNDYYLSSSRVVPFSYIST